jgi:LysR family transcriptional activator of nhaA
MIIAEFDDSALIKFFAQLGHGAFCTATIIEDHVCNQYGVTVIGRTTEVKESFYAISVERKMTHPEVRLLAQTASKLFEEKL